ncbi:hypothetical protein [Qiania dongpingensis]|uniref:ASCH domain-containing protein n=1 Tax=Qiania dongpingensis TaxID=2763669 RepID=A0A7G9G701_9FIRM|nr:hypothetical protein [Qiania dongpingensis]QNM06583.1 hypothetical protein H9Q78_05475 [Qiania dongpingensis]
MSRVLPILFNTDMVRAILDGRKTVTRRVIKPQPTGKVEHHTGYQIDEWYEMKESESGCKCLSQMNPPYQPLDIMYVRETWWKNGDTYFYKAGCSKGLIDNMYVKWRPSIHMPKEAARIWLKVTDVRAERLQEITDEQAAREGIRAYTKDDKLFKYAVTDDWWIDFHKKHRKLFSGTFWQDMPKTAKEALSYLWDSTIQKSDLDLYGWEANPWVWRIEFERCEKPDNWN